MQETITYTTCKCHLCVIQLIQKTMKDAEKIVKIGKNVNKKLDKKIQHVTKQSRDIMKPCKQNGGSDLLSDFFMRLISVVNYVIIDYLLPWTVYLNTESGENYISNLDNRSIETLFIILSILYEMYQPIYDMNILVPYIESARNIVGTNLEDPNNVSIIITRDHLQTLERIIFATGIRKLGRYVENNLPNYVLPQDYNIGLQALLTMIAYYRDI